MEDHFFSYFSAKRRGRPEVHGSSGYIYADAQFRTAAQRLPKIAQYALFHKRNFQPVR
jgi:hypothetical protein